ncbi:1061_t:CDS:2 [Diversispora eburnea]|uniref:1061_t:CDS:1 n=1 Tax=Diversispora eburnea TaxID=1213867 RepID=A0A9N8WFR4_9GLOM|nr:1061_t:CDS:2 [Diversispora eburnea]
MRNCTRSNTLSTSSNINTRNTQDRKEEKDDEQIAFRESVQKKLKEMEEDFQRRQNETYEERLNQLNQDIINVRQGSSPIFKEELQKFINKHDEELEEAQMKRDYYLKCIQKEYEEEIQIVENYYSRKKKEIDDALVGDIEARKKLLFEDIKTYDQINDGELKGHVYAIPVRILRSKTKMTLNSDTQEKNNKSKRLPERPFVSEKLNDHEVERDLAKIYMVS